MEVDTFLNLLYKRLANELTEEEANHLDAWLEESPSHRATAAEVEATWEASEVLRAEPEVDLDAEFAFLEARIEAELPEETPAVFTVVAEEASSASLDADTEAEPEVLPLGQQNSSRKMFRVYASVAAGIALLVVGGLFLRSALNKDKVLSFNTLATNNAMTSVTLKDGSQVTLDAHSELKYSDDFIEGKRKVELKGRAFFEVAKDPEHPFEVQVDGAAVTVLGTRFAVSSQTGENQQAVQVEEGKVSVKVDFAPEAQILVAGDKVTWDQTTQDLQLENGASPNGMAWFTQTLQFQDEPLEKVLNTIGEHYGADIRSESSDLLQCPLTVSFKQQKLKQALDKLALILGAKWSKESKGTYLLTGGTCQ